MSYSAQVPDNHNPRLHRTNVHAKLVITYMAFKFLIVCLISYLVLISLTTLPHFSIFVVDLLFCSYLCSIFSPKIRYLFLIHPIILLLSSMFYNVPFLQLGDGEAYQIVVDQYSESSGLLAVFGSFQLLDAFKYMSLGVAPVYLVPTYLYETPVSSVYYLWQGLYFVILIAICVTLAKSFSVIRNDYLLMIALFAVVSPSFYDLGAAPTRHTVTFISIFLFYVSFVALYKKFSVYRLTVLLTSVALVVISKFNLMIPIIIFSFYYSLYEKRNVSNLKKFLIVIVIFSLIGFGFNVFLSNLMEYSENSTTGAASFSGLVSIPIFGIFFKYLYALLSPFPWQNATTYIETTYGGNEFLFFMHMLSSLSGVYFFARLLLYGKPILVENPEIRPMIVFGIIMSFSILFGSTGFHVYLLIYFPFFSPLLLIKRYQLNFLFPIVFVMMVEAIYTMASL